MKNFLHRRLTSERGIALVMTLAILVMVTMLVVAFAVSMRVESMGAKNFNTMIQARQLAQGAVDQAVGQIRSATQFGGTWMTMPGAIYWRSGNVWTNVQLYTTNVSNAGSINLNAGSWITGVNSLYPANQTMYVSWSNQWVVVSGTTTQYSRYAYWVDDESAKVNVNVAGTRGADLEGWTTKAIDLTALFSSADQVSITATAAVRSFDTLDCIQQANGVTQVDEYTNQFYMTTVSTSPDYTPWGDKRLNLSNLVASATTLALRQQAVNTVKAMLSTNSLRAWFGMTFAEKYTNIAQVAANIVDYVGPNISAGGYPTDNGVWNDTSAPQYLGLKQTPYLNELVISNTIVITTNGAGATMTITNNAIVELRYMYTGTSWNPPTGTEIYLMNLPSITFSGGGGVTPAASWTFNPVTIVASNTTMGDSLPYLAIPSATNSSTTFNIASTNQDLYITLNPGTVTAIYRVNGSYRIDYAQIPLTTYVLTNTVANFVAGLTTGRYSTNFIWSTWCNDPRVKPISNNWTPYVTQGSQSLGAGNTLCRYGTTNNVTLWLNAANVTVGMIEDGDMSCHTNPVPVNRGAMTPGEMAFIHTGYPWRTFWLQPQSSNELNPTISTNLIPDWAVLDLFSATDSTNSIGRMNVNAMITNCTPNFPQRIRPLDALMTNVSLVSLSNIYTNRANPASPALVHNLLTMFPALCTNGMTFIGEVCEVVGLTNGFPNTKISVETPTRGIANLTATRGNDFTIWAIAQSLQLIKTNAVPELFITNVTGEAKIQAIVERDDSSGSVKFRTRYLRYSTQ